MFTLHKPLTLMVKEYRAFTPHCFTNEGLLPAQTHVSPQHGGMKLDEFNISNVCASTKCHGNTVTS
jgi:hypothetical protein